MKPSAWLSSAAALALLRVRPQTLYASVSRKRIRVKRDPEDPRRRLYHAGDVQRLAARRGRPSRERVAREAVSWGSPVLDSGVSTVAQGRLWYRGVDAVQLAAGATLEEAAAVLWQSGRVTFSPGADAGAADSPHSSYSPDSPDSPSWQGLSPLQAVYRALAARAGVDPPMQGRAPAVLQVEAAALMCGVADAVLGAIAGQQRSPRAHTSPLHERLARAWRRPRAADLIRRALVLLADHELNASTFATRVAASTGACLPACLLAGFATLSGPLHGTASSGILALAQAAASVGARSAIRARLDAGERLAAFGHPLYPDGDVRAQALLAVIPVPPVYAQLEQAGVELIGEPPNVDFALAALAAGAGLPADAPFVLFALARTTGWIAHALEHHQGGSLIRPRARYTGPALKLG